MSFKCVYKLVAERKIIQLENKWSPRKNAFFLSSIGKMLLVFVPDKPPQSKSDAGEGSGGKKKRCKQTRRSERRHVCVCRGKRERETKNTTRFLPDVFLTAKEMFWNLKKVEKNYRDTTQPFR